jgi:hypothetical protein
MVTWLRASDSWVHYWFGSALAFFALSVAGRSLDEIASTLFPQVACAALLHVDEARPTVDTAAAPTEIAARHGDRRPTAGSHQPTPARVYVAGRRYFSRYVRTHAQLTARTH